MLFGDGFWRNMMATNLDGAFLTIRECLGSMRQTDWGRVLTIASIAGVRHRFWPRQGPNRS